MLTYEQVNTLGDILNSTWGRGNKDTFQCKAELQGEQLIVTYNTIAYFASEKSMSIQAPLLEEESSARIADLISNTKKAYKDRTGDGIKLTALSSTDGFELIQASAVNPRKVAIYRRRAYFQVG